jgi:hypothetical protein
MDGYLSSLHSTHLPGRAVHLLAPNMPVRDGDDARWRALNFRASMDACPSCWRTYFEVHASLMEREMN